MGFEIYLHCFGEDEKRGISRAAVRAALPVVDESRPDLWLVRYDHGQECAVGLTAAATPGCVKSLYVDRPCSDPRLWDALVFLMRLGDVVAFWPGGPPVVTAQANLSALPQDMAEGLGPARIVSEGAELQQLVRSS